MNTLTTQEMKDRTAAIDIMRSDTTTVTQESLLGICSRKLDALI